MSSQSTRYRHSTNTHRRNRYNFKDHNNINGPNDITFVRLLQVLNFKAIWYYCCIIIVAIIMFITLTYLTNHEHDTSTTITAPTQENTNTKPKIMGLAHKSVNSDTKHNDKQCLYTYMQLTDGSFNYLYGILAIHGALIRTKSSYSHNIMLMPNVSQSQIDLFHHLGIGTYHIDGSTMDPYLKDCGNCWTVTFYKLFIFNMTSFDKILYLDTDVGIMHYHGIDELFDHPTPSAVSDRGGNHFELNGGVLLVSPNDKLFQTLLDFLPNVRNRKEIDDKSKAESRAPPEFDNWNSEYRDFCGDQGYQNAFFNSNQTGYGPFYALHYRYGLLTSSFSNEWQRYLLMHRPYILKNVHFTVYKPWHQDGYNRFRQMTDNIERAAKRKGGYAGYQDEVMARFFVRYWLDIKIALEKCGMFCKRHFPDFDVPNDVERFLKYRPEPFTCFEQRIEYIPDHEFKKNNKGKTCP